MKNCYSVISVAAGGVCRHPVDYLIPDPASILDNYFGDTVYAFTDPFGNCSGCVKEISVCYLTSEPNPMTVVIINEAGTIVHTYSFTGPHTNTDFPSTQCMDYQSFLVCCCNQTVASSEQFTVQSSDYYAFWSHENIGRQHVFQMVTGHYITQALTPLEVGTYINSTETYDIPKIYLHIVITPGKYNTLQDESS